MTRTRRGLRLAPGHEVTLLQGGAELFPAMRAAIGIARQEVRIETYILSSDGEGERMVLALEEAAARGVSVYLLVDGVGTPALPAAWRDRLSGAGAQVRVYKPAGKWIWMFPSRWRRLHRKLCLIDGELAFCGGINIVDDRLDTQSHQPLAAPRFDFAVSVRGPLTTALREIMARTWWRELAVRQAREADWRAAWRALQASWNPEVHRGGPAGARMPAGEATGPAGPSGRSHRGVRAALVLRDNLQHRRRIERTYLRAIAGARQEVLIANAYFLPGRALRRALTDAAGRGVKVILLLQGRYEYFMQYHGVRPVYRPLLAAGVEIHEYAPSFLHAKVAVVDQRWATVGSSNLDPLSLLLAREANVVVEDPAFAGDLRARLMQAIARGGVRVDGQHEADRRWHERLLDHLAYGLMRLAIFLTGRRY